jgi:hypothetical protein
LDEHREQFMGDVPTEPDGGGRKPFLLRLPPDLHAELKRWAAAELRSLNGQIEFVLRDALRRRGAQKSERDSGPERPASDDG